MPLPQVKITQTQGRLRRLSPFQDRCALLSISEAITGKFELNETYTIYAIKGAEDLGFTADKNANFLSQIKDFYRVAPVGTPLVIAGIAKTDSFNKVFDAEGIADRVLKAAGGEITLIGISHLQHSGSYPYTYAGGLKGKIQSAPVLAQAFAERAKAQSQPLHVLIGGNDCDSLSNLTSYASAAHHHVSLLISGEDLQTKYAAVGLVLGYMASLPPQRKLSRVRNGALPINKSYFVTGHRTDQTTIHYHDLHTKRYLFFRTYPGKSGYYIADDCTLAAPSNEWASIAANRVLNKAIRISYQVFIHEIGEELQVSADGTLSAEAALYYKGLIEDAIGGQMVADRELNAVEAFVDPEQKVIQNDKLSITLNLQPVGYASFIEVSVGFSLSINA